MILSMLGNFFHSAFTSLKLIFLICHLLKPLIVVLKDKKGKKYVYMYKNNHFINKIIDYAQG